jgi:hypothetical protein
MHVLERAAEVQQHQQQPADSGHSATHGRLPILRPVGSLAPLSHHAPCSDFIPCSALALQISFQMAGFWKG